ncbi:MULTISPECIES: hypothetical protein [unclassified Bradyrhizobium]|jgi:hypothetical protein|uniref:hypothetical protein n=1 Tax=unclassified Bradyrhizobium TaxID=2631580 RepID=UPI00070AB7BE|nr:MULTISPECIES: hypothetical protein [unclassified Bradyrhizobium]KQT09026.1 hypothetical protein ASG57_35580 [Bradyrhizobium sp. Leaf396]
MLETDQQLTAPQTKELRERWDEQTKGDGAGGTPILAWGLKAKPVTVTAQDGHPRIQGSVALGRPRISLRAAIVRSPPIANSLSRMTPSNGHGNPSDWHDRRELQ